jgi:hypothetical protein
MASWLRILFLMVLFAGTVVAQPTDHIMIGSATTDGSDLGYKLVFTLNGNTVKGYSITTDNGRSLKADIHGSFDKSTKQFNFIETKIVKESDLFRACYFDVKMTWRLSHGHYIFSGTFIGRNDDHSLCSGGTVYFDVPETQDKLYDDRVAKVKKPELKKPEPKIAVIKKPEVTPEPEKESYEITKVTAESSKEFLWKTDSCILEIWDAEVADGDIVTVLFNGQQVLTSYTLASARRRIILPLSAKNNKLEIIAESEGKAPPNTSRILLTDGTRSYTLLSRIHTGERATILLKKK